MTAEMPCSSTTKLTDLPNESRPLPKEEVRYLQQVIGTFLCYAAQAVDPTMLVAIGSLASSIAYATENTQKDLTQFLNYAATHPDAKISCCASNIDQFRFCWQKGADNKADYVTKQLGLSIVASTIWCAQWNFTPGRHCRHHLF